MRFLKKLGLLLLELCLAAVIALGVIHFFLTPINGAGGSVMDNKPEVSASGSIGTIKTARFLAVGDIMLSRKVNTLISSGGFNYPIADIAGFLAAADITMANLESPLATSGTALPGKGIWFRAPPENVNTLLNAGIDWVTLANNHMVDYDTPALTETIEVLDKAGIAHTGAGVNDTEARKPLIREINGIKIAFLGYSEMGDIFFSWDYRRTLMATDTQAGINNYTLERVLQDIKDVEESADIIIVTLHWGLEYNDYPEEYQKEEARRLIDGGADFVIGHHPHCMQGMEVYNGGIIAYSLGNFIFDQNFSDQTREGLVLDLEISPLGWISARIWPVFILESRPHLSTGEEADAILNRLIDISRDFGVNWQRDGDSLIITGGEPK